MKKIITGTLVAIGIVAMTPFPAFAHVIVTPGQANVGAELVFNVSVPNEEKVPVTNIKLLIPGGVSEVVPTSKDGWTITTTTDGKTDDPDVTQIVWSGGTIPVGQRQDFSFGAQAPGKAGDLDWKAYQTYADGTVVHWDQTPAGSDDATGDAGSYSVTHVANDLTGTATSTNTPNETLSLALSVVAIALAICSLFIHKRR